MCVVFFNPCRPLLYWPVQFLSRIRNSSCVLPNLVLACVLFTVSLARLLFPQVLDVVMDMSQVDAYSEFTRIQYGSPRAGVASKRRKHCVDLNEEPTKRLAGLIGCSISDESKESRMEVLKQRCDALGKASMYLMPYLLFVSYCRFCSCLPVTLDAYFGFEFKAVSGVQQSQETEVLWIYACKICFVFLS